MNKILLVLVLFLVVVGCSSKKEEKPAPAIVVNEDAKRDYEYNTHSVIDRNSDLIIINNHEYNYIINSVDALSSASGAGTGAIITQEEKEELMHWSIQPPMGLIEGEYYYGEIDFNGNYKAMASVVYDNELIVHVELDEVAPANYYEKTWANQPKRTSGYTFFQAANERTTRSLVTWVNGVTYLEWQVLHANKLDLDYQTVNGSANSARDGFIPLLKGMADVVNIPSN
ncbi:MAG: hypothetical protein ACRCTA_04765, partial [Bacilli bacterium]